MNHMVSIRYSFLIVVVLIGSGCQRAASTASPTNPATLAETPLSQRNGATKVIVDWGKEANGLRSRIWSDKPRFDTTEPIVVHYAVQNVSAKPATVWHSGFWPNHRIDVIGPNGQPAKFADGGEARWKAFTPGGTREKNAPFTLQPGAIDDAYVAYNLRDIFAISAPGEYHVQYIYQEAKEDLPLVSNDLVFSVE
jgi:hypothetical protein